MEEQTLLAQYFKDLTHSKPLTQQEEFDLTRKIRAGSQKAREKLVLANLRFVITIAQEYQNRGLPLDDLIGAGNLGLMMAAERFDETRGFKFISYAVWWIRQAIRQSLSQETRIVRLPVNRIALLGKIHTAYTDALQTGKPKPDPEALGKILDVPSDMIRETLKQAQHVGSLDAPLDKENGNTLLEITADQRVIPQDEIVERDATRRHIHDVLQTIDSREAEIIRLYFGLDRDAPMTLEEIGRQFNLTRERIRQIKEKALLKMRHPKRRAKLEDLMESA